MNARVKTAGKGPLRKDVILDQATDLFSRHGFEGTSMRMIARASGITEAAIYRHFDNKSHLYQEVIRTKASGLDIAQLEQGGSSDESVEDVLSRTAHHILEVATSDPQLMRLMFHNSLERGASAALLFKEVRLPYILFLKGELEKRMDRGEVRHVDPLITSRCFVGMVMDCALSIDVWSSLMSSQFKAGDVVCNNVPIFARGLLTGSAS